MNRNGFLEASGQVCDEKSEEMVYNEEKPENGVVIMKRIWNGLRYGDWETRKCIGGVILFIIVGIALIIVSGLLGKILLFALGMLSGVVALMLSQTFTLEDEDYVAQVNEAGQKETVRSVSVMRDGVSSRVAQQKTEETHSKEGKARQEAEAAAEAAVEAAAASFSHYDQQLLKKVRRKYRVKKDHRPVLIDSSKSYHIKECPAFIWRAHNKVFLLLLEKEPRRISISRDLIRHMDYVPHVRAHRSKEYLAFQKENLVTSVFGEFIPDYFDSKSENHDSKYKNLYQIYPDIRLSNRCAATVMDLLYLNFMPDDKITQSEKLNGFFKRVYAAHILFQDHVYSITEYKESVEKTLKEMCYAEMPQQEFSLTLENLVRGRMISQEYADYYMEVKRKLV
jgi:hypothetical protein